jgi:hypothetical protein
MPGGGDGGGGSAGGGEGSNSIYYCALGHGNAACLANDPRPDPPRSDGSSSGGGGGGGGGGSGGARAGALQGNAALLVPRVAGLPVPLLVAVRPIPAGGEVLLDYGEQYWGAWRRLRANTDAAAASAGRPMR